MEYSPDFDRIPERDWSDSGDSADASAANERNDAAHLIEEIEGKKRESTRTRTSAHTFHKRLLNVCSEAEAINIIAEKIRRERTIVECWSVHCDALSDCESSDRLELAVESDLEQQPNLLHAIPFFESDSMVLWESESSLHKSCLRAIKTNRAVMQTCDSLPGHLVLVVPDLTESQKTDPQKSDTGSQNPNTTATAISIEENAGTSDKRPNDQRLHSKTNRVVCALIESKSTAQVMQLQTSIELIVERLAMWRLHQSHCDQNRFARFVMECNQMISATADKKHDQAAAVYLVNRISELLSCHRVAVTRPNVANQQRVIAISGTDAVGKTSALNELKSACELTAIEAQSDDAKPIIWRRSQSNDRSKENAGDVQNQLRIVADTFSSELVAIIPLTSKRDNDLDGKQTDSENHQIKRSGNLILLGDESMLERIETAYALQTFGRLVGGQFALRDSENSKRRWKHRLIRFVRTNPFRVAMLALVIFVLLMALPLNYKIKTDSVLEPVSRRFVTAPFDSRLNKTLVEPGSIVSAGEVIARLDDSEIKIERSTLIATLQRESKSFDSALARGNIAESQIAKHEIEKIELQIELAEKRLAQLDIVAPIDGVIVSGDLEKAEGSPLTVGQTIFEIAPLDRINVEVLIPESKVAMVRPGMEVNLHTDAFPLEKFCSEISRIHPRSEMRNDQNVFVAEFELNNETHALRPGMRGRATVISERRSLGWILFHRAWEQIAFRLNW